MPQRNLSVLTVLYLIIAIGMAVAAAFYVGMRVQRYSAGHWETVGSIDDTVFDDDDETAPVEGEIDIQWRAESNRDESTPFNFYLRQWYEDERGDGIAQYEYSTEVLGDVDDEGGEYSGYSLLDEKVLFEEGMGSSTAHYYILQKGENDHDAVVLENYIFQDAWGSFTDIVAPENLELETLDGMAVSTDRIAGYGDAPETFTSSTEDRGEVTFTKLGISSSRETITDLREIASISHRALYRVLGGSAFFLKLGDGRLVWYDLDVPFWVVGDEKTNSYPDILWDDGTLVTQTYNKAVVGGCGYSSATDVVTDIPELVASGHATNDASIVIYTPKDYGDSAIEDLYDNWKWFQTNQDANADMSIAAFGAIRPVFYYKDALGRTIRFISTSVIAPGECGKPVIYLYPPTTTDISVRLAPQGGFTKTEPAYGNGWNVIAHQDGSLVNKADGKTYPYLFWEGRGGYYESPKQFWVVAEADVHAFLVKTLAQLGLNAKESADFMEFWEPRMQGSPYYKVGFHGTSVMNTIAPMILSMKPDTTLRILMDFSPLTSQIAQNPPRLSPVPARHGFSVVEWGGVIR